MPSLVLGCLTPLISYVCHAMMLFQAAASIDACSLTFAPEQCCILRLCGAQDLTDEGWDVLFHPLWSLSELHDCRRACFGSMGQDSMIAGFSLWGGVASRVYSYANSDWAA